jgi:hypothetical protein
MTIRVVCTVLGMLSSVAACGSAAAQTPRVIGWTETVTIRSLDTGDAQPVIKLAAKIDTGAATSSIDANAGRPFTRDGARVVSLAITDATGTENIVKAEIIRSVLIRRAGVASQRRLVVRLSLCVAGATGPAEFTVTDRKGQDAPVLVGRAFLGGRFLVDSAVSNTAPAACGVE